MGLRSGHYGKIVMVITRISLPTPGYPARFP